jgi:hypothetical protein
VHQVRVRSEAGVRPLDLPVALHVDGAVAVHHHLVDRRVGEQRLEWPEAGGQEQDALAEHRPLGFRQRRCLTVDQRPHPLTHVRAGVLALPGALDEALAERTGELLDRLHAG